MPHCVICGEWQPTSVAECSKGHGPFATSAEELRSQLDRVVPTLAEARAIFGDVTPPIPSDDDEAAAYANDLWPLRQFHCSRCGAGSDYLDAYETLLSIAEQALGSIDAWHALLATGDEDGRIHPDLADAGASAAATIDLIRRAVHLGLIRDGLPERVCGDCLWAAAQPA